MKIVLLILWLSFFTLSFWSARRSSSQSGSSFTIKSNIEVECKLFSPELPSFPRISGTIPSLVISWVRSSSRKSSQTCKIIPSAEYWPQLLWHSVSERVHPAAAVLARAQGWQNFKNAVFQSIRKSLECIYNFYLQFFVAMSSLLASVDIPHVSNT